MKQTMGGRSFNITSSAFVDTIVQWFSGSVVGSVLVSVVQGFSGSVVQWLVQWFSDSVVGSVDGSVVDSVVQ